MVELAPTFKVLVSGETGSGHTSFRCGFPLVRTFGIEPSSQEGEQLEAYLKVAQALRDAI